MKIRNVMLIVVGMALFFMACKDPAVLQFKAQLDRVAPGDTVRIDYGYVYAKTLAQINIYDEPANHQKLASLPFGDNSGVFKHKADNGGHWFYELQIENNHKSKTFETQVIVWPELKFIDWSDHGTEFSPGEYLRLEYAFEGADEAYIKKQVGGSEIQIAIQLAPNGKYVSNTFEEPFKQPATYTLVMKNEYDGFVTSGPITTKAK